MACSRDESGIKEGERRVREEWNGVRDRGWFLYIETRVERGYEEVTFAIFRNDMVCISLKEIWKMSDFLDF